MKKLWVLGSVQLHWLLKDKLHFTVVSLQCKNIKWILDAMILQLLEQQNYFSVNSDPDLA